MNLDKLQVDPDIRHARTLPGWAYTSPDLFEVVREKVFARSWQFLTDVGVVAKRGSVLPLPFQPGLLDEPLLLTRDSKGVLHCISNVCTHRGNLVVSRASVQSGLRCRYHGRRFELCGRFRSMPEFEQAADFPRPEDDLPAIPVADWRGFLFAALDPSIAFEEWSAEMRNCLRDFPLESCVLDEARSRDYQVDANWAVYCDNYLEGFHIPFVHPSLGMSIDYESYRTELYPWGSLQLAFARDGETAFEDRGDGSAQVPAIAAYYFWLFPGTMFNVYPWGVSINIVEPQAVDRTTVRFLSYVSRPELLDEGAGGALDRVEQEDEEIVEACQRGLRSRLYGRGRYSPTRERGVHHFHRLLAAQLSG